MDLPVGLSVAVYAGVLVVGVVVAVAARRQEAGVVAVGVGAWLALDLGLAAAGVFATDADTWVPVIGVGIVGPVVVGTWLLSDPTGRVAVLADRLPMRWLIEVQLFRVVGAVFLVGWAVGVMPAAFAIPAGTGDVAVGLAAPWVARRVGRDPVGGRGAAVIWNVAGVADLAVAVTLGFLTAPSHMQQLAGSDPNFAISRLPFVLIPVFAVPVALLLHGIGLRRLTSERVFV